MRILDDAGNELADADESLGSLVPERLLVEEGRPYVPAKVERVCDWEGPNGDRLYKRVVVEPEQAAKAPVYEDVMRYVPYTEDELAEIAAQKAAAEEAAKEAAAEAARQAALKAQLEQLPGQVGDLEEAVAEVGGAIGESDASIAALQSDVADLMGAVAEIGTLVAGEE